MNVADMFAWFAQESRHAAEQTTDLRRREIVHLIASRPNTAEI
jgi:hypothetical protein